MGYNASVRDIKCKVVVDFTSPFLDESITVTSTEVNRIATLQQTADSVTSMSAKYLLLDGLGALDGTWCLGGGQVGWFGTSASDASAEFSSPYPSLTITHTSRPIQSIKVIGDDKRNEYPVDFTVKLYDVSNTLLHTQTVTGNSAVTYNETISAVADVVKQVLTITKWSTAGTCVKIAEFYTSIQETFERDDIFQINLLEEREVSEGSLPIGSISSNEIDIRIYNKDRIFDAGNTMSPLYGAIKPNRRVKVYLYEDTEDLTPLGVFWTGEWTVPENALWAQTTGRDRISMLGQSTFSSGEVYEDYSLLDLFELVLTDAGLETGEYVIDTNLDLTTVPYAYFESQSHREALRKLAEAGLAQVYCDREGIIQIEGPEFSSGASVLTLTSDHYFNKDNPTNWGTLYNYIIVDTQPLVPGSSETVFVDIEAETIDNAEVITRLVYFNTVPCLNASATVTGNAVLTSATYYSWGASCVITGTSTGTYTLSITAEPLEIKNKQRSVAQDSASIAENGKLTYTFPGNPFVQTLAQAQAISASILASYKDPRRDVTLDWRGDPTIELGDKITVIDTYGNNDYIVVSNRIEYDGTLREETKGRKA